MLTLIQSKLKELIQRLFDIRVGEFRRVLLMLINIFLLIQCLWIIKPIVNAQFLSRVGVENLPLVFFLVALTALAVSTAYSRLLNRASLGAMIKGTYLTSILCLLLFAILFNLDLFMDWMSYLFYIGVALFSLIMTSQFWLLGNMIFNSLEAKRLFGFIGAGAIAGGISGGYLTSILAPLMESTNLLYVASGLLIINMLINRRIWATFVPKSDTLPDQKLTKAEYQYPLRLIQNSKLLTYLALIIGISVVVAKLVEYQYSAIASESIEDADDLTAFFGFWFSTSNAVSLVIQLLATQRIIALLGVGRSLLVLPSALFAGAAMVLYAPVLWAGTALKVFDISLKQSIQKAATELLILPIPIGIKNQTKTFIDVFVDAAATGLGGIILIFLINGLDLSVRAVCIMILVLIGVWIYLALRVQKEYLLTFRDKLGLSRQTFKNKGFQISDTTVLEGLKKTLRTGSTPQLLFLLGKIEESKDQRLMPDLIPLLEHESPSVRQAVLRCLYYYSDHDVTTQVKPLLKDEDPEVRSRAFSCILAHTRQDRIGFIQRSLKDEDPAIKGAALVGLSTEARNNPEMQKLFKLDQLIRERLDQIDNLSDSTKISSVKILVARAIGHGKLKRFYPLLTEYMQDSDEVVRKQAINAAGNTRDLEFVSLLLDLLASKNTRSTATKALSKYPPSEVLPVLAEMSREKELALEILIQLPAVLETMDTQQAIDLLFELVHHSDPTVKQNALEALHKVKVIFPHLTMSDKRIMPILMEEAGLFKDTLAISYTSQKNIEKEQPGQKIQENRKDLIRLLELHLDRTLERIFWILGLNYPPGIILPLYKDIQHSDPAIRLNTVELLDNLLEPPLKKVVLPLVETAILDAVSKDVLKRLDVEVSSEYACFESLLKGEDNSLKIAVLKLIEALDDPKYAPLLNVARRDENSKVQLLAKRILEQL